MTLRKERCSGVGAVKQTFLAKVLNTRETPKERAEALDLHLNTGIKEINNNKLHELPSFTQSKKEVLSFCQDGWFHQIWIILTPKALKCCTFLKF